MIRPVLLCGAALLSVAAQAQTTYTNKSFSYGGGFSGATEVITSPYTGSSYSAGLANASLTGVLPGTTNWEFNFATSHGQKITGFQVIIDGTLSGASGANDGKISLTSLDVLNGSANNANVFDLGHNGGGAESKFVSNGAFSLDFPVSGYFNITTKGGITQGQFSVGDTYQVTGGGKLTISQIIVNPEAVPEPTSFLALGIPAVGLFFRKRKKALAN